MTSILDTEVSCFADYNTPDNPRPVNLLQWLTSTKYAEKVAAIRNIADKDQRDRLKATLPAITPSGLFSYRAKKNLIRHSGFIQVDIDPKGNEAISNYSDLKKEICNISNIAYCGLSVSGKGYWALIPIEDPTKHCQYFLFIEQWFKERGVQIDKAPKSVSSLRGYAYDPDGYFNHEAIPLKKYSTNPVKRKAAHRITGIADDIFLYAQRFADKKAGSFRPGENGHNYIFHLCSYLCYRGISRQDAESWVYKNLLPANEIKSNCISYPFENFSAGEIKAIEQPEKIKPATNEPDRVIKIPPVMANHSQEKRVREYKENWNNEITELETFFGSERWPAGAIALSGGTTITDCTLFLQSHIATLKANNGNKTFLPYMERTRALRQFFENNKYLQK